MKSHFQFTKGQRNGIFILITLIIIFQSIYFFVEFPSKDIQENEAIMQEFKKELDSLKLAEIESRKPKVYPFNPNYLTDYKGYTLGMSQEEINRLLDFRKQNSWINTAKQFQDVTKVSDSLLARISPYFKFPEWVTNPKQKQSSFTSNIEKSFNQKIDLNKATAKHLQIVNGIGEKLSDRIIRYRDKFPGGFIADVQLQDVYGLKPEVIEAIKKQFTVKTPRKINKINLNTATVEQLVTVQHIDYELAYEIIDQRTLREGFKNFKELTKVKDFPIEKLEIIKLYLSLN
ncbi:MAG: helix-hairpin-helix domain-containing protein [Flavobacteriaceae bacterium]|nr:helix-hairpin-helix domain-containing protein [Flavobacteriaceae bacterium]